MELPDSFQNAAWLRILRPEALSRLGHIRHVLFDFDGTLSVLRQGWEAVMIPMMVAAICGSNPVTSEIEGVVSSYVDRSSGILTIRQMQWLADAVQQFGLTGTARTAGEYKADYLARLMVQVHERLGCLARGESKPSEHMLAGAVEFVQGLVLCGARLYLASGTDHIAVLKEAGVLGLLPFFEGGVFGALDNNENHAKERVIQQILEQNQLAGAELLVVGDGPVEIREGAARQALTLGVASDEVARAGWNQRKVERLTAAGADLLVADFRHAADLIRLLCGIPETTSANSAGVNRSEAAT